MFLPEKFPVLQPTQMNSAAECKQTAPSGCKRSRQRSIADQPEREFPGRPDESLSKQISLWEL